MTRDCGAQEKLLFEYLNLPNVQDLSEFSRDHVENLDGFQPRVRSLMWVIQRENPRRCCRFSFRDDIRRS